MARQDGIDLIEQKRLNDARQNGIPWKKKGPYLSERQWGTVCEDYSDLEMDMGQVSDRLVREQVGGTRLVK
jgi:hypothetical protein